MNEQIEFDGTDPVAVLVSWSLTMIAGEVLTKSQQKRFRVLLPTVAILSAIMFRAVYATVSGEQIDARLILRALAAGSVAVFNHSQSREFMKMIRREREEELD